jgi:hypothetical protein
LGYYQLMVRGYDNDGNIWQRVYYYHCQRKCCESSVNYCIHPASSSIDNNTSTVSPSPSALPSECYNGGQLINANTSDAYCYCSAYFTGVMCEMKQCFNNGILNGATHECICDQGWSGTHCTNGSFITLHFILYFVRNKYGLDNISRSLID